MTDYKSLYYGLFNGITDVAKAIESTALTTQDEQLRDTLEKHIISLRQLQLNSENKMISENYSTRHKCRYYK